MYLSCERVNFFFSNYKTLSESESGRKLEGGEIKRITTAI